MPQAFQPGFGLGGMMGMGGFTGGGGRAGGGFGGGLGGLGGGLGGLVGGQGKGRAGTAPTGGSSTSSPATGNIGTVPAPVSPPPKTVVELTKQLARDKENKASDAKAPDIHALRNYYNQGTLIQQLAESKKGEKKEAAENAMAQLDQLKALDRARALYNSQQHKDVQGGRLGVDIAVQNNALRFQNRLTQTANRYVQKRNLLDVGGVWIDEKFDPKMPTLVVKAQSAAYFRLLERRPQMKEVLALGNYLVWVSPSGTALIVDRNDGRDTLTDEAIDRLFVVPAKKTKK